MIWLVVVSASWVMFIWIANGMIQYLSLSFSSMDINKYIPIIRFIKQPTFFLLIFLVIFHVYVKAKKDLYVWPSISIELELLGISLSSIFIISIIFNEHNIVAITLIMYHFMFLLLRDILVYFGYKGLRNR